MSDYTELKRLAELLHGAEWQLVDGDGFDADNRFVTSQRRIDDNKVAFAEINYGHPEAGMGEPFQSEQVAAGEFIAAANPAAVLALIAENERLRVDLKSVVRLNNENADLFKEKNDQLRAEIAGLKTGYEAYERVNAELKAENERIERNRDMWKGQVERQAEELRLAHEADKLLKAECEGLPKHAPSSEIIWCECGDGYPANSYGAGFMDANEGVCANCDAALGQGEQS